MGKEKAKMKRDLQLQYKVLNVIQEHQDEQQWTNHIANKAIEDLQHTKCEPMLTMSRPRLTSKTNCQSTLFSVVCYSAMLMMTLLIVMSESSTTTKIKT